MKTHLRILLPLLLFLTLSFGTSLTAGAATLRTAEVNVSVLNVRSGPGTSHARIDTVSANTMLPVLSEQSGWVQIRLTDGRTGWVSAQFVNLKSHQPTQTASVTATTLNVRSGPGTSFTRIATVSAGTVLPVLHQQGSWLQIWLANAQLGWIHGTYATLGTVNSPAQQEGTVNVSSLNVRSGPGTNFGIITTVSQNTRLVILQTQNGWLQVRLPSGQTGWVSAQFVTIGQPTPAPTPSPSPAPSPTPTPQPIATQPTEPVRYATVTVASLNVRTGPSANHDRITSIPLGTTVRITGQQDDWLQVVLADGRTGWIAGWHVTISTDGAKSPVAGRTIVIDPGHGGPNPGAVGVTGLRESEVVMDVSLRVADMLRQAGARVILTRDANSNPSLGARVQTAQAAGAHVFVSVHANAHPNPAIGGTETYYFANKARSRESLQLSTLLQSELVRGLGLRDIGVKHGNFHVIRETTMPSALVELAFLSNATEEALMRTNAFRQNSAEAIFRGLENYFRMN